MENYENIRMNARCIIETVEFDLIWEDLRDEFEGYLKEVVKNLDRMQSLHI